jgi:raffinose/stachyose/melibiose transport system permease protein
MRTSGRETITGHTIIVLAAIIALYPFLSILALAVSPPGHEPTGVALPSHLYLGNFTKAWRDGMFSSALRSSLLVAVCVVVGTLILAVPAGYAMARVRSRAMGVVMAVLLLGLVMPYEAMVIALYHLFDGWHLLNTYPALVLPQIALSLSFATLWLRSSFGAIPTALLEAAELDGAGRFGILRSVVLPMSVPAITTLATLLFLFTWNEFLLALVLIPSDVAHQTAPLALSFFSGDRRQSRPAVTAAAAVIVALPILLAYVVMQRRFITGMFAGGVKE